MRLISKSKDRPTKRTQMFCCQMRKRHIQRLRRAEGLRVPPTKRKAIRRGLSTGLPTTATHRNHVWTWDFIADATVRGGALRILTILDEHIRECHVTALIGDESGATGAAVNGLILTIGKPQILTAKNQLLH